MAVAQWGLSKKNCIKEVKYKFGSISYVISTLGGQSGAPIVKIGEGGKMSVVGIHKGAKAIKD